MVVDKGQLRMEGEKNLNLQCMQGEDNFLGSMPYPFNLFPVSIAIILRISDMVISDLRRL